MNQDEPSVGKIEHAIPRDRLLDGGVATQEDGLVGPEQLDVLQRQRLLSGDEKEFVVLGSFCLTSWSGGTNGGLTLIFVSSRAGEGYSSPVCQSEDRSVFLDGRTLAACRVWDFPVFDIKVPRGRQT